MRARPISWHSSWSAVRAKNICSTSRGGWALDGDFGLNGFCVCFCELVVGLNIEETIFSFPPTLCQSSISWLYLEQLECHIIAINTDTNNPLSPTTPAQLPDLFAQIFGNTQHTLSKRTCGCAPERAHLPCVLNPMHG